MKRTMLIGFAMCVAVLGQAAIPTVQSVEKVQLPAGVTVSTATLSPDGRHAVVSPLSGQGLHYLDLTNGKMTEISKGGAASDVTFTADGTNVVYREASFDNNHRRFVALKAYNVANGNTTTLVSPTRNLQGFQVDGNQAIAIENGRKMAKAVNSDAKAQGHAVLSINYGKLYVNGNEIRPLGNQCGSYLWPTLNPDGKRIAVFGVGTGTITCDLDGSNVKVLGMYRAPQWLDNETIVAMDDYDNGVVTVKSTIMAINADGSAKAALTGNDVVAVFPTPAQNKIAFTTPQGELYIINLK